MKLVTQVVFVDGDELVVLGRLGQFAGGRPDLERYLNRATSGQPFDREALGALGNVLNELSNALEEQTTATYWEGIIPELSDAVTRDGIVAERLVHVGWVDEARELVLAALRLLLAENARRAS